MAGEIDRFIKSLHALKTAANTIESTSPKFLRGRAVVNEFADLLLSYLGDNYQTKAKNSSEVDVWSFGSSWLAKKAASKALEVSAAVSAGKFYYFLAEDWKDGSQVDKTTYQLILKFAQEFFQSGPTIIPKTDPESVHDSLVQRLTQFKNTTVMPWLGMFRHLAPPDLLKPNTVAASTAVTHDEKHTPASTQAAQTDAKEVIEVSTPYQQVLKLVADTLNEMTEIGMVWEQARTNPQSIPDDVRTEWLFEAAEKLGIHAGNLEDAAHKLKKIIDDLKAQPDNAAAAMQQSQTSEQIKMLEACRNKCIADAAKAKQFVDEITMAAVADPASPATQSAQVYATQTKISSMSAPTSAALATGAAIPHPQASSAPPTAVENAARPNVDVTLKINALAGKIEKYVADNTSFWKNFAGWFLYKIVSKERVEAMRRDTTQDSSIPNTMKNLMLREYDKISQAQTLLTTLRDFTQHPLLTAHPEQHTPESAAKRFYQLIDKSNVSPLLETDKRMSRYLGEARNSLPPSNSDVKVDAPAESAPSRSGPSMGHTT